MQETGKHNEAWRGILRKGTDRSWLWLSLALLGLGAALAVNPQPLLAAQGYECLQSSGNMCCYDCISGAKVDCSELSCTFPNHAWFEIES